MFGLTSTEEIHAAVLAAVDPKLARTNDALVEIDNAAKSAGGMYSLAGTIIPKMVSAYLRQKIKPDKPLVFDDLERSCLKVKDLLGVINTYVEHHNFRVIVITHEEELRKKFQESKEKLFGQTILVLPQIDEAFEKFISIFKEQNVTTFFEDHKENIISVFKESGVMSLRILRYVIEDLGRLHATLTIDHLANSQAMTELVLLFCAFNIEVRIGRLKENDLRRRVRCEEMYELKRLGDNQVDEIAKPRLLVSNERYLAIDLEDGDLLNDDILVQMFIEGCYLESSIKDSVDGSSYFKKPEDTPPWKIIFQMHRREFGEVEAAEKNMQRQFENREVTEPGEILHIFSLRMMMSNKDLLGESLHEVVSSCKSYIDDLLRDDILTPWEPEEARGFDDESHGGCAYWVIEVYKEQFREVKHYLLNARKRAFEKKFPGIARELLELVQN